MKNIYLAIKNTMDRLSAVIALIVLSPIFLLVGLFVKLDSPMEAVIFKQIRTGKDGIPFTIYKFRSMKSNLNKESVKENKEYGWASEVPDDFVFKSVGTTQANVSKIGQLIRKFSLDELPQLYNVLKGDMSLVGPRPEIPEITKFYSTFQQQRLAVKPGITGWAQVNGRSNMTHGRKITLDRHYVQHLNLRLDIQILLSTVFLMLSGKDSV